MHELKIDDTLADSLKREVDISGEATSPAAGQQVIWTDVMAERHALLPQAATICRAVVVLSLIHI